MARYLLSITLPDRKIWDTYSYGSAESVFSVARSDGRVRYLAVFDSEYLANYQNDRFASGLYYGRVLVEDS